MESIGDEYFGDLGVVSVLIDKKYIKSKKFEKGSLIGTGLNLNYIKPLTEYILYY